MVEIMDLDELAAKLSDEAASLDEEATVVDKETTKAARCTNAPSPESTLR